MTKSELRQRVIDTGSHFFDRSTMRFFGDTMANYSCGKNPIEVKDRQGNTRKVYALWRKRTVKDGLGDTAYFDAETFARVFPKGQFDSVQSGSH